MFKMCDISGAVSVRGARAEDRAAREAVLRAALRSQLRPAVVHFILQEVTLQCCVLCGAVLFIFCGASLAGAALVVPAVAALVALAVGLWHARAARAIPQKLREEEVGLVAEYSGPPPSAAVPGRHTDHTDNLTHTMIVGTVSVSQYYGPRRSGWLHSLAVDPRWRRRGVGRALESAARDLARSEGLESLEAVTSQLQPHARSLLHAAGWRARGSYHRPLLGAALTLPMAPLGVDLLTTH